MEAELQPGLVESSREIDGEEEPGRSSGCSRRPSLFLPPLKLQKLILRFPAGAAEQRGLASPIFHISYTVHWMASPHTVTAGHIYERCIPETYHWPDIARAQRFESHPALYANSLMELRHSQGHVAGGRRAAADQLEKSYDT